MSKPTNIKKTKGFTIVELLVVIVVIGILAAISIVSYTGVTKKAKESAALSQVDIVRNAAESIYAGAQGYPYQKTDFTIGTTTDGITVKIADVFGTPSIDNADKVTYTPCSSTATAPSSIATTNSYKITYYTASGNVTKSYGTTTTCGTAF